MVELRAIAGPTGRQLRELLVARGVPLTAERGGARVNGIISYGVHVGDAGVPTLNAKAGALDKLQELQRFQEKGIPTPGIQMRLPDTGSWLGRQRHHAQGRGINVYRNGALVGRHRAAPEFYTQLMEKVSEYRVWAFRRTPKALYQKVLRHPGERHRASVVWNYENGFAFEFIEPERRDALKLEIMRIGAQAVNALDLDFGAADIIVTATGQIYVLEVNTAPGVEGPRWGITSLADSMARWVNDGFPRRRGEAREQEARRAPGQRPGVAERLNAAADELATRLADERRREEEEARREEEARQATAQRVAALQLARRAELQAAITAARDAETAHSRATRQLRLNTVNAERALEELE